MISDVDTKNQFILRRAVSQDDRQSSRSSSVVTSVLHHVLNESHLAKSGSLPNGQLSSRFDLHVRGAHAGEVWTMGFSAVSFKEQETFVRDLVSAARKSARLSMSFFERLPKAAENPILAVQLKYSTESVQ